MSSAGAAWLREDFPSARICFFGHSHKPSFFGQMGTVPPVGTTNTYQLNPMNRYLINPGAVGQPRDRDARASYAMYDSGMRRFTLYRVPYNVDAARKRILGAGLPAILADRLARGA